MNITYKYILDAEETVTVLELPYDSKILSVQDQNGVLCLWANVRTEPSIIEKRTFIIVGTGHEIEYSSTWNFIATVQQGMYVWHIFEIKNN